MDVKFNSIKQGEYSTPSVRFIEVDAISVLCVSGDVTTEDLTIDELYGW